MLHDEFKAEYYCSLDVIEEVRERWGREEKILAGSQSIPELKL